MKLGAIFRENPAISSRGKAYPGGKMTARLSVTRIFCWHLAAIAALGLLNLAVLAGDAAGYHGMLGFSSLFRLSGEGNVPNLFSALAIAATALVAARIAQAETLRDGERQGWRLFALLLAFMAIDEAVQLHESLNAIGLRLRATGPWFHIGVFPYAMVAIGLAIILYRFWARQSRAVRIGIASAGICYVVAAIGMEVAENMLYGAGVSLYDRRMAALFALEELGEMAAVALFLRTFLVRFEELGAGPLLALVGARPLLAIEISEPPDRVDAYNAAEIAQRGRIAR